MGKGKKVAPEGGGEKKKGGCCAKLTGKVNGFQDANNEDDAAGTANGISPGKGRKCRDVCCLALFAVFWLGMMVICSVALNTGDPYRLLYGSDYEGEACGGTSRENTPFVYYPRMNKDLLDAYLNRGKCAYLIGDTGLAFMDFQKLIVLEPKNPSVHIYAGNLLMTTGSYEDATKAFTNADNIQKSPLALYQRSRCHVALNNMAEALDDLNKVIEISMTDKVAIQDRECLNALKSCSVLCLGDEEPIEKVVFQKAAQAITKLISYEKNEHLAKLAHESSI